MIALALKIFAVGKLKDASFSLKCEDYLKKIKFDTRLEVIEIKDSDKAAEGEKLITAVKKNPCYAIALTENGKEYTSLELARHLGRINKTVVFIIGGHHGLDSNVLKCSDEVIALSKLTFTHEMARLILLEQIYRAVSILNNRSYHR
ncbi:MAG: 23S rRNA (pseudouridine(1915)-N(3))-methyltransferase RlmH [Chitinispirillaceae bacterium]|nr:23S rRNA (pseudouridine(1915)-N(3))-methyltransferase RlmH [Chitinispirillaceae bacterium]